MSYPEDEKVTAPSRDAALETSSTEKNMGGETDGSYGEVESAGFDVPRTKKLLRKTDKALLPFLALLYLLSFLDRTNIGNAKLANLEEDLGMEGLDYNVSRRPQGLQCCSNLRAMQRNEECVAKSKGRTMLQVMELKRGHTRQSKLR